MSGIKSSRGKSEQQPRGVPNPTRPATNTSTSGLVYSRRYLDWNRLTFEYHATDSQAKTFDSHAGLDVSGEITEIRKQLNLSALYGCAPETWCASCAPFGSEGSIFSLVPVALGATVINASRSTIPRYVIVNTGSIRFDLVKGPFTFDDSFIVSPFNDLFQFIPSVPYQYAKNVISSLNGQVLTDKRSESPGYRYASMPLPRAPLDSCTDPDFGFLHSEHDHEEELKRNTGITRRQTVVTPGYVTSDDFGTDGDDTPHSSIPFFEVPNYVGGNASFPDDGSLLGDNDPVDVVFLDFFASDVVSALAAMGATYTTADVESYVDPSFNAQSYMPAYAKITPSWQANVPNCPVGEGVGFADRR